MKNLFLLLPLLLSLQMVSAADEIRFEQSTYSEALAKAKTENKLVFLDAFTSWCGPCKWMAKTAFTDSTVASYFNSHFVNLTIDMEKGEGIDLAKKYAVAAYPTLLFLDGMGTVVHTAVGARSAVDLLKLGQDVAEGKVLNISDLNKKFEGGERDHKFLHDYILELGRANMDFSIPLDAYKLQMKGAALLEPDNWEIFNYFFRRNDTEYAQFFLANLPAFEEKFGRMPVQSKVLSICTFDLNKVCENKDKAGYNGIKDKLTQIGIDSLVPVFLEMDLIWYAAIKDWKKYASTVDAVSSIGKADAYVLNSAAWTFFENVKSKSLLKKALGWIEESVRLEKSSANLDTYAMVLHKLGHKEQAIAAARESILLGKVEDEDCSETEKALAEWLK